MPLPKHQLLSANLPDTARLESSAAKPRVFTTCALFGSMAGCINSLHCSRSLLLCTFMPKIRLPASSSSNPFPTLMENRCRTSFTFRRSMARAAPTFR